MISVCFSAIHFSLHFYACRTLQYTIPTQVHSYGKCLNNRAEPGTDVIPEDPRWPAVAQRRARKIKILSQYKFYLAFENAPVEDYVSEKVRK